MVKSSRLATGRRANKSPSKDSRWWSRAKMMMTPPDMPYKPPRKQDVLLLLGRDHKNVACLVDWWREDVKIKPQQTVSAPVLCFELAGSTCLEALEELGPAEGLCVGLTSDRCGLGSRPFAGHRPPRRQAEGSALSRDATKISAGIGTDPARLLKIVRLRATARKARGRAAGRLSGSDPLYWEQMVPSTGDDGVLHEGQRGRGRLGARGVHYRRASYGRTALPWGRREHAVLRRVSRVLGPFPEQVGQYLMGLGVPDAAWTRGRRRVSKPLVEAP